ncbi:MAG: cytochrome c [Pseudomonadota bacterium]|jgi:mono/diheme cytochrome c family protein
MKLPERPLFWGLLAAAGLLSACGQSAGKYNAIDLLEGEAIYKAECARCHGAKLEGEPNWRQPRPDGKLPAPPHDASGTSWRHTHEELAAIVKHGMVPPHAPAGYVSDMPAFGRKMTAEQVRRVLTYIESTWPPEIHAQRAALFKTQR